MTPYTEISLLIICYNGEKYLKQCLDSVAGQTYRNFRLIFVDDGSEDGTADVFFDWKNSCARSDIDIIYSRISHQKQAAACKEGLKYVSGDMFTWADADDVLLPEFLEEFAFYFRNHTDRRIVRCNSDLVDEELKPLGRRAFEEPYLHELNNMAFKLVSGELSTQGAGLYAMKTDLLNEIYGAKEFPLSSAGQNLQLILPAVSRAECGFINKTLSCYRIRPDSESHMKRSLPEILERIDHFYELLKTLAPLCGSMEETILNQAEEYRKKERQLAMKQAADNARKRAQDNSTKPGLRLGIREKRLFQALYKKDYSMDEMEQILKGLDPDICSTQFYMAFAHLCAMHDWKYVPEKIRRRARRVQQYHRTRSALLLPALGRVAGFLSEHDIRIMILSGTAMNVFYARQMPIVSTVIDISAEPGRTVAAYQLLKKEFYLKYLMPEGAVFIVNASPVMLRWGFSMNGIADEEGIWARAETAMIDGTELSVPSPADMFIREAVEEYNRIFIRHADNRELRFAVYAGAILDKITGGPDKEHLIDAVAQSTGYFASDYHRTKCRQAIKIMLEGYRDALREIPSGDMSFVIEKVYTQSFRGKQRLCSEVRRGSGSSVLWIEADENLGELFADDRADFAVLALINQAVMREADIVSDIPISGGLKEALELQVIPALMLRWNRKEKIKLKMPVIPSVCSGGREDGSCGGNSRGNLKRRTAVFSGITLDDVWTIEEYCGDKKAYRRPVDDILTVNAGGYSTEVNDRISKKAEEAALRYSLTSVKVDTNLEVLNDCERFEDVRFLRIAACMYGMTRRYEEVTVSEQMPANRMLHRMNELSYLDYYFAGSLSSDCMRFRPAGAGTTRSEKIADLVAKNIEWGSACAKDGKLCGHCSSCHADIVILAILGDDKRIKKNYNEDEPERNFDFHLAYCMAEKKYGCIPELMEKNGIPFSARCIAMAKNINDAQERIMSDAPQILARRIQDVKA